MDATTPAAAAPAQVEAVDPKAAEAAPKGQKRKGGYLPIYLLLIVTLSVSTYSFLLITIGMLPTFITMIIERNSERPCSSIIGAFNLTGLMPYIASLFTQIAQLDTAAKAFFGNFYTWFSIYSIAALGYIIVWGIPQLFGALYIFKAQSKLASYKDEQEKLVDEWSEEVSRNSGNFNV